MASMRKLLNWGGARSTTPRDPRVAWHRLHTMTSDRTYSRIWASVVDRFSYNDRFWLRTFHRVGQAWLPISADVPTDRL